ncbi:MAG: hypothetical protein M3463_08975 [Verrucomicrobiota bacterium]|nr:hypothetical protein [Verrucomicrobiota bacterium]
MHPLQIESVGWVTERNNLLAGFFSLLTFWGYVRFTERPGVLRYALFFVPFVLAILSKPPMAVMLPLLLVLLDYWPLARLPENPFRDAPSRRLLAIRLVEKLPLLAISCAAAMVTI